MGRKSKIDLQKQLLLTRKEVEACLPQNIERLSDQQLYIITSSIYEFSKLIKDNLNV